MKREMNIFRFSGFKLAFLVISILCFAGISDVTFAKTSKIDPDSKKEMASDPPGVFFYRLEPSFYTGFAPRCQDPKRIHIHLGRGNQLRITIELSDQIIDEYLADLALRYRVYDQLIRDSKMTLSQNMGFEKFERIIMDEKIQEMVGKKKSMSKNQYRKISLEMLKKLNPGKVFHIKIDFDQRMRQWSSLLGSLEGKKFSQGEGLDLINQMLPTRVIVTELSNPLKTKLEYVLNLYGRYEKSRDEKSWEKFYMASVDLFNAATGQIYPFKGKILDFYEFTAIYPVGTLNEFAKFEDDKLPLYPCPGKRSLCVHQRTKRVDHIPDIPVYGYLPWIPYMHVGKKLHNSFHSLWFSIDTRKNDFIPDEWRNNTKDSRSGKPYSHLWLLSRGPMSHGCTHVNAGNISELRQMLPSDEKSLRQVVTYRNKSNHFDVFDIDGDGHPEVMGIKYYYAYSLKGKKPYKMRAPSDRKSFYKWLYKDHYRYDREGQVIFEKAATSKFVGKRAVKGKTYYDVPLYEADYSPETIQFFKLTNIPFVRELRRVSSTYSLNPKVLKLNGK
jgi:hypothetical protein